MAHAFGRPELPRSLLPFQARLPRGFHEFNHVNIDLAKGLSKTCGMTSLVVNWLI
jgi:hypothetical protein